MIFYHRFPPVLCPLLSACQCGRKVPWKSIQKQQEQTSFPGDSVFSGNSGTRDHGNLSKYSAWEPKCLLLSEHISHRTLFKRQPIYILCENRTKGKLAWADVVCAKAVILDLSVHDYVCCLSTYIIICCYYCFFQTVSHFNIRRINCCLMTYDQIQMVF